MKKILASLGERMKGGLYAFAALADVSQSPKLSALYGDNQSLIQYVNSIFRVAISAGAIIAVLRLGYAGYLYMGGDLWHKKEAARQIIRDTFLGLFLLLAVYIILAQINPNLLNLDVRLSALPQVAPAPGTILTPAQMVADVQRIIGDDSRVRGILSNAGVCTNKSSCTSGSQQNCTSLGGLGDSAISGLAALRSNWASFGGTCIVTVTGGTEYWLHGGNTQHLPDNSVVDLGRNAVLDNYITQNGKCSTTSTFKQGQTIPVCTLNGATYYQEDSAHWHVKY